MIAKQIKGLDFSAALAYNFRKTELTSGKKAIVLGSNFSKNTQETIKKEMYVSRSLKPNLKRFFYHTALSFYPEEKISDNTMKSIAETYLEKNGFNQHSYIIFRHRDADHPHMHILVSRIGSDKTVLSDSNDYQRSEKTVREIEQEFNLIPTLSSKLAEKKAMTMVEIEMMKRTGKPSYKLILQEKLDRILDQSKTITDFITNAEKEEINLLFNQASTGRVSGISYMYDGFKAKGQALGNKFKFLNIAKKLNYGQEADHQRISAANERTGIAAEKGTKHTSIPRSEGKRVDQKDVRKNRGVRR